MTTAMWLRNFVQSHPDYKQDSVVSQEINYDLVKRIDEIERGVRQAPELLGTGYRTAKDVEIVPGQTTVADAPGCTS